MKPCQSIAVGLLALLMVLSSSCKSQYDLILTSTDSDLKYKKAFEYFEKKKYLKAAQLFESLSEISGNTSRDDTIKFYWGYSNYLYKDYHVAEANFKSFINLFPYSPFTEKAKFLRIDCMYRGTYRYELDQLPTYDAISEISKFIIENPGSEYLDACKAMMDDLSLRLDKKAYEAAYIYYHMEDYLAAKVALKNVLKDDADNVYREDILFYTAMASYKYAFNSVAKKQKERYMQFVDDYYYFVSEYPDSAHRKELDNCYEKAQRYLRKK